jgi:hypothetical protein
MARTQALHSIRLPLPINPYSSDWPGPNFYANQAYCNGYRDALESKRTRHVANPGVNHAFYDMGWNDAKGDLELCQKK